MRLYHGSLVRDFVPTYGLGNDGHDYGRGFYLTADRELGCEWAVGQRSGSDGWLHVYEADLSALSVFDFAEAGVLAWMAELMKHRAADDSPRYRRDAVRFIAKYGVDISGYDVVKGWRANASFFFVARLFVQNQLDVSVLEEMLSLGNLGIQYFFQSRKAFAALRELEDAKESVASEPYKVKFDRRDQEARERMVSLAYDQKRNPLLRTFDDLLKEGK